MRLYAEYQKLQENKPKDKDYVPKYTDLENLNTQLNKLEETLNEQISTQMFFIKKEWYKYLDKVKIKKKAETSYVYILTEMGLDKSNMFLYINLKRAKLFL